MENSDSVGQAFAQTALMQLLFRHGGSLRAAPLLRLSGLPVDHLCAILNELLVRQWLRARRRRKPRPTLPGRLRRLDRIIITRWGRYRMLRESDTRPSE